MRRLCRAILEEQRQEALSIVFGSERLDLLLLDEAMPHGQGWKCWRDCIRLTSPFVVMSGHLHPDDAAAKRLRAIVLQKSFGSTNCSRLSKPR